VTNGNGTRSVQRRATLFLSVVEFLLCGHPDELLPDPHDGQSVSDRDRFVQVADRWSRNPSLTDDERARINAVWINKEWLPPVAFTTQRAIELRALLRQGGGR
jgi:hypothetical protein